MKKHLSAIILLGLGLAACQSQSTSSSVASAKVAVPILQEPSVKAVVAPLIPDSTAEVQHLLQTTDLAPLWAGMTDGQPAKSAMDGFYGENHYHIAFYFDSVRRDVHQPALYHVWGRDRYKHVTTPFEGTWMITRMVPLADTVSMKDSQLLKSYSAHATFSLLEDPTTKGAGVYTGRAYLDFCFDLTGKPVPCEFMDMDAGSGNPTKGSGVVFNGRWRNNKTGATKPVAWANWYGVVVPDALRKLGLGERGDQVNPELARYGWGEKWENDEWWTKSPKPSLSL